MLKHGSTPVVSSGAKPNVLLILTDQQRHDAVGYINPQIITPNLNMLAKQSVVITNAHVQSPQCQPSRASILTGRYPTAHKVWWNETPLPGNERTFGNLLHSVGYDTAYFGKLHVENPNVDVAIHYGFKHRFLFEDWSTFIIENTLDGYKEIARKDFYGGMGDKCWVGRISDKRLHHEEVITNKAIEYIKKASQPFLAVVSYHGPHPPYAAPDEFSKLYELSSLSVPSERVPNLNGYLMSDHDWRSLKRQYYGAVSWIDDNIGRLLRSVDDNCVVIFLSDHGDILGDHGLFSKGIYAYDGNVRIPMLMRLPGVKPATYDHLVQAIDVFPTICSAVGIEVPFGVQGRSLYKAFKQDIKVNESIVSMLCFVDRLRMIRTKSHKYWIAGNQEHLYDLMADPSESINLIQQPKNKDLLNEMRFMLMRKLIECEDPLPRPRPA